jgi:hypothetical protein
MSTVVRPPGDPLAALFVLARSKASAILRKGWSGADLDDALGDLWVPFSARFRGKEPTEADATKWLTEGARRRVLGAATQGKKRTAIVSTLALTPDAIGSASGKVTARERAALIPTGYELRKDGYLWPKGGEPVNSSALDCPEGSAVVPLEPHHVNAAVALYQLAELFDFEVPSMSKVLVDRIERAYLAAFGHKAIDAGWVTMARLLDGGLERLQRARITLTAKGTPPDGTEIRSFFPDLPAWVSDDDLAAMFTRAALGVGGRRKKDGPVRQSIPEVVLAFVNKQRRARRLPPFRTARDAGLAPRRRNSTR